MEHPFEGFQADITRVSREVARQFAAAWGRFGHGYEIVSAEDNEQAVYEQFIRSGITAENLDAMDSAQAYIRTTARLYGANNEARSRRRALQVDFTPGLGGFGAAVINNRRYASTYGNPEDSLRLDLLLEAVEQTAIDLVESIGTKTQRQTARLFYLEGLNSFEIAERQGSGPGGCSKGAPASQRRPRPPGRRFAPSVA